jgi:hypothetical protein
VSEVFDPKRWVFDGTRLTAAGTLKTSVEGDDDEARLGERAAVDTARRLFLATADRVGADDCGILLALVENRREMDVRGDVSVHVSVSDCYAFHFVSAVVV